jgi:hydrophobe/amphiphile efflux-1 (HAE1) family protein
MNLGRISVEKSVLAIVSSLFILIVGALAFLALPISEYPNVVPPTVTVSTTYPGASAQTVADTVATPIEQEVNGVEGMLYMYSQATSDGVLTLTITFKQGTDVDKAQVLVQNRVATAVPRLPEPVQRNGVLTKKSSPSILCAVFLYSPDGSRDPLYVSNFATGRVADVLKRINGIGDLVPFGARDYSLRIWLNPDRASSFGLSESDILDAVRAQNTQVAGGMAGEAPIKTQAFQKNLIFEGRMKEPGQFDRIIVKSSPDGRVVRLKDVARVEFGALTYSASGFMYQKPTTALELHQQAGSNAVATVAEVQRTMETLKREFPSGIEYSMAYNPTAHIVESIKAIVHTTYEAVFLVVAVILIFLKGWRPSLIAVLAMPVSLVGTFAVMLMLGMSINYLTLFGLVLAVGIVVDDAIVVVENVERHIEEGQSPREATLATMDEVGGALFGIALVLCAVFVPTAFVPGIVGEFFRDFGLTIAIATAISCFNSLTLSPALASLLLKASPSHGSSGRPDAGIVRKTLKALGDGFDRVFHRLSESYGLLVRRLIDVSRYMIAIYIVLIAATGYLLLNTPKGFIPTQDRDYLLVIAQLPAGASLARTTELAHQVETVALGIPGIVAVPVFAGLSGATATLSPSTATVFPIMGPAEERRKHGQTADQLAVELRKRLASISGANFVVVSPPPVPGIGTTGGFAMRLEDRGGLGPDALAKATNDLVSAANATPGMARVYTTFSVGSPQVKVEVDRDRAEMLGVTVQTINSAIETYFGSTYVNDLNVIGRTYHVTAQADLPFRATAEQLNRVKVRNVRGDMVPLANVTKLQDILGSERVPRYNLYPASEISGETTADKGSAFAATTMEALAHKVLPAGISFEWTDLTYQQTTAGNTGLLVLPLCVIFVYLVLAAQYGSWTLPLSILLIVPMCLLAASLGIRVMGQDLNVLTQIGFITLIGLAAKNAILIVEFARHLEEQGMGTLEAVVVSSRLRLRPILMTSFAFILGVLPLLTNDAAGSEMRQAVGASVFFGMIGVTIFGLLFTPIFYVLVRRIGARKLGSATPMGSVGLSGERG